MKTWQAQAVEINPGSYSELSALTGKANVFYIVNGSDNDIYVSMSNIPRLDSYEKVVKRNSTDVFGRPTPVSRVYFLNASSETVVITVWYTYADDFDFSIMKSLTLSLDNAAQEAIKYDGIIQGVKTGVKLPVDNSYFATISSNVAAIKTTLETEATTNQTILEGINTILQTL